MHSSDTERQILADRIYNINEEDFGSVAMEVWNYQYRSNEVYRAYCDLVKRGLHEVHHVRDIPFIPIELFKKHDIRSGQWKAEMVFKSSGTTGVVQSRHLIRSLQWYHRIADLCFKSAFGGLQDHVWVALLPSYTDRPDSSLVDMVQYFMQRNGKKGNKFYPDIDNALHQELHKLKSKKQPTILFAVSFALLELFKNPDVPVWDELWVIETGGMKGRGPELTREELHARLSMNRSSMRIASEYGMTELTSQAYWLDGYFIPGPTMRMYMRDISDPFQIVNHGQRGAINVIDLGNLDTCSFIATDDLGISFADHSFDVLGRIDQSDMRGCNLMYV
jgi:hypothetical protein